MPLPPLSTSARPTFAELRTSSVPARVHGILVQVARKQGGHKAAVAGIPGYLVDINMSDVIRRKFLTDIGEGQLYNAPEGADVETEQATADAWRQFMSWMSRATGNVLCARRRGNTEAATWWIREQYNSGTLNENQAKALKTAVRRLVPQYQTGPQYQTPPPQAPAVAAAAAIIPAASGKARLDQFPCAYRKATGCPAIHRTVASLYYHENASVEHAAHRTVLTDCGICGSTYGDASGRGRHLTHSEDIRVGTPGRSELDADQILRAFLRNGWPVAASPEEITRIFRARGWPMPTGAPAVAQSSPAAEPAAAAPEPAADQGQDQEQAGDTAAAADSGPVPALAAAESNGHAVAAPGALAGPGTGLPSEDMAVEGLLNLYRAATTAQDRIARLEAEVTRLTAELEQERAGRKADQAAAESNSDDVRAFLDMAQRLKERGAI